MMNSKHIKTLAYAIALLAGGMYSAQAPAHGALFSPSSRAVQYYGKQWPATEIEGLKLPAGGTMEADTPFENQFTFPPDGKLASGNKDTRAALDDESYPWVSQPMHSGVQNFEWFFGQFHRTTYFTYYITKQDWKTKPGYGQRLTAEMFENQPFCHYIWPMSQPIPSPSPTKLTHVCNVPERTGEQKIYAAWRIRDTDKAFYQLVDVKFDGDDSPGGDTGQQQPVIHVANEKVVVDQSSANAGYTLDASGTQYATGYVWEVISGDNNFQLQEKQGSITASRLEGSSLNAPRAWVAANHTGTGVYRVTASNQYGSVTKDITVEVKASDSGNDDSDDTGAIPAYDSHTKYDVPCTNVAHNGKIWQNQWYLNPGQEEPGTGGEWGGWRQTGTSNNSCK